MLDIAAGVGGAGDEEPEWPTTRLDHDVFTGGQILSYEFRDMLVQGEILPNAAESPDSAPELQ